MPAATSTPRWQSWPMLAWAPERGSSTPTLRAAPCARRIDGAATSVAVAAAPAVKLRRVTCVECESGLRSMSVLPYRGAATARLWRYCSFGSARDAMPVMSNGA